MVAWELTRNCNLNCVHCRAAASKGPHEGELTLSECKQVLDQIAGFASPTIILTGGEPLMRNDIFDIIEYGNVKGLRLVMAINGTLLTEEKAQRLKEYGIKRVSLSLDGKNVKNHDAFRGVIGSFNSVMKAADYLNGVDLPFQINTTVTRFNVDDLLDIYNLIKAMGAVAWHVFLLVPVGRAKDLKGKELDTEAYEDVLHWLYDMESKNEIEMKVTCAPHYSFMFISHKGIAQPCGYLELASGDVRAHGVQKVWEESPVFNQLRDLTSYRGKCGRCRYLKICGGCRARAYELHGDFLHEEPYCSYNGQVDE
ncbi:MAG: Radical domain protein [Deltaproteobacteria bacterium]|nr:Radical domain protein [Deltaproteobacteria bacterium]